MSKASPRLIYHGAYEGNPYSKLRRYIAEKGYNANSAILLATVTKSAPELEITLDDGLKLEAEDLVVARHLTKHKRVITMRKSSDSQFPTDIQLGSSNVTETMTAAGLGPHTHDITQIKMSDVQDDLTAINIEIEYQDELKVGDRVFVVESEEDMIYYVIDIAHWY